jgi:hypothetical protein
MLGGIIILIFVSIVCLIAYIIDDGYLKKCAKVRKRRIEKRYQNLD